MHAGKDLYTSSAGKHNVWYKTDFITLKTVLTFQTLMLATLRQMGHNPRQGSFSGQDLLLDFAAWIDLTSNAGNTLIKSKVQSYKTHFVSLKCVNDLRVYRGFMIPLNHQAGYKVVDRALTHHISFPSVWMVFALTLDRFMCCVSRHNNLCKNLFPDFALYAICCFNNKLLIDTLVLEESKKTEREKKLANLISGRCHDTTNSILVGSAPYPLAVTKQ